MRRIWRSYRLSSLGDNTKLVIVVDITCDATCYQKQRRTKLIPLSAIPLENEDDSDLPLLRRRVKVSDRR